MHQSRELQTRCHGVESENFPEQVIRQKKGIMKRIEGIQRHMQTRNRVGGLRRLKKKLQIEMSQQISQEKSRIFYSKNIVRSMRDMLGRMSGFGETVVLGKYLGVPLIGKANRKEEYCYVIDRDVVASSNNVGGLGLCKLDIMNKACISKHGWKLQNNNGELWYVLYSTNACPDIIVGIQQDGKSFSVGTMYGLLDEYGEGTSSETWTNIWKIQATERVRHFVWILQHDRLPTNSRKHRMDLGSVMCSFCNNV
ncbi:hypothetical protein KIW84_032334 [Lathyrus oleraceus]|uniref:Reverse transcriptase zinc-binding domain-containing protein n=1 Tax=Pisum sativum TaxID=3888 RepID=A0A9D4XU09_PEA|nr:hypothetical protein KIW84_032334 [Pisum sativum]